MNTAMTSISVVAVLIVSAVVAEAKPRVVVLDFDGPAAQAKAARADLVAGLADKYDLVATAAWTEARANATGASPFRAAAKNARVDAIIEGWFDTGGTPTLTLAVRDAVTGKELDQLAQPVRNLEVTRSVIRGLLQRLDEVLMQLDHSIGEPEPVLPQAAVAPAQRARAAARPVVAQAEPAPDNVLAEIFQPRAIHNDEQAIVLGRGPRPPATHLQLSIGPYLQSRGMDFQANAESTGAALTYPGSPLYGIAAKAALYPFPSADPHGRLSGPGVTFEIQHSFSASLDAADPTGVEGSWSIKHVNWEAQAHWRWLLDLASIDIGGGYGETVYNMDALPGNIQIPSTDYRYVSGGGRVDLAVSDRASVGAGLRYLYLLSAGEVSENMWYGPGSAYGLVVNVDATIPMPHHTFVTAGIEYRRYEIDFSGTLGQLTYDWDLKSILDSAVTGSVQLGVSL
jgi:hypothetical protein